MRMSIRAQTYSERQMLTRRTIGNSSRIFIERKQQRKLNLIAKRKWNDFVRQHREASAVSMWPGHATLSNGVSETLLLSSSLRSLWLRTPSIAVVGFNGSQWPKCYLRVSGSPGRNRGVSWVAIHWKGSILPMWISWINATILGSNIPQIHQDNPITMELYIVIVKNEHR